MDRASRGSARKSLTTFRHTHARRRRLSCGRNEATTSLAVLPPDLVAHVAGYLDAASMSRLVAALAGYAPTVQRRAHVLAVPIELRAAWVYHTLMCDGEAFLHNLADKCLYLARDYSAALVFFDWSPFSDERPRPVAEYYWSAKPPHARVELHRPRLHQALLRSCRHQRPQAQVAVYVCLRWHGRTALQTRPAHLTWYPLCPLFLAPAIGGAASRACRP